MHKKHANSLLSNQVSLICYYVKLSQFSTKLTLLVKLGKLFSSCKKSVRRECVDVSTDDVSGDKQSDQFHNLSNVVVDVVDVDVVDVVVVDVDGMANSGHR